MTDRNERVVERLARRLTGPWQTRRVGPLVSRYRRRPDRDWLAFHVAVADLWHAIRRSPEWRALRRFMRRVAR